MKDGLDVQRLARALNRIHPNDTRPRGWAWLVPRKPSWWDRREFGDVRGGNAEFAAALAAEYEATQ